jgi:hypothetical protein
MAVLPIVQSPLGSQFLPMQTDTLEGTSRFVIDAPKPDSPDLAGGTHALSQDLPARVRPTTQRSLSPQIRRNRLRVVAFFNTLNSEPFKNFTRPVNLEQIETALQFLDRHFGDWEGDDSDDSLAAWDYVLPAVHELYPDRKPFGYTAKFGPGRTAQSSFFFWFCLVSSVLLTAGFGALALYVLMSK